MSILSDLADRVGMLAQKSEQILAETLVDNSAFIEDAVTGQMEEGRRADGSEILPDYNPDYARLKAQLGLQSGHVDLKLTGDFHNSVTSQVQKLARQLNITATDEKTPFLLNKYDVRDQLLNLSEENLNELERVYILPDQVNELRNFLING